MTKRELPFFIPQTLINTEINYPIFEIVKFKNRYIKELSDDFWNISDPPEKIFVQGKPTSLSLLERLPESGLAVVGTRNPQLRSLQLVRKCIQELRGSELIILSGFARGVDTAAHFEALEAGLPTIAILGTGHDLNYPAENQDLRKRILEAGGLLISEYPAGSPGRGYHFLKRNRLIAAWSKATWVVEASFRSGALNTARWAREMDKTCFAVPCFPGDSPFAGNQTLIDRDHALPFWGTHSLGAAWIELSSHPLKKTSLPSPSSQVKTSIYQAALLNQVKLLTSQKGGATLEELFNWALSQEWEPERFFTQLRISSEEKLLFEQKGIWLSYES